MDDKTDGPTALNGLTKPLCVTIPPSENPSEPSSPFHVFMKTLGTGRRYLAAAASFFLVIPQGEAQLFDYIQALRGFGGGNLPTAQARNVPDSRRCMLRRFILHG